MPNWAAPFWLPFLRPIVHALEMRLQLLIGQLGRGDEVGWLPYVAEEESQTE